MIKLVHISHSATLAVTSTFVLCLSPVCAAESADWREDYKSLAAATYAKNYDQATQYALSALNKAIEVKDNTEKEIALEEISKQLRTLKWAYKRDQNYSQEEIVLKAQLKADGARTKKNVSFLVKQDKKNLATCLVLEGKDKEAKKYLADGDSDDYDNANPPIAASGWRRDLDLLSQADSRNNTDDLVKYADKTVTEVVVINNSTERKVALSETLQKLQTNQYRFKSKKDYSNQEKMLKLILKVQQAQEAQEQPDTGNPFAALGAYQSAGTLRDLVTCLVYEGKNDEAAKYDAQCKAITDNAQKQAQPFLKNFQQQTPPAQNKTGDASKDTPSSDETKQHDLTK